MRSRTLVALALAYCAFGVGLGVVAVGRWGGDPSALDGADSLPWWVFLAAAALDVVLGVGILKRIAAALWLLRVIHAALAVVVAGVAVRHVVEGVAFAAAALDGAKAVVHAALAYFWWRSRSAALWFACSTRENHGPR
jgi:hypothetical protein